MTKIGKVLVILTVMIVLAFVGFKLNVASGVWRYKMTVVVDTPEGTKTGFSIREVRNSASKFKIINLPESSNPASGSGEAVLVDLGKRGKLFALLSGYKDGPDHYKNVLYRVFGGGTSFDGVRALNQIPIGAKANLTPEDYPILVIFSDMNDPRTVMPILSVEKVGTGYPEKYEITEDRFARAFGEGVKLKEISIERVDDPITNNIEKILPEYKEQFWIWFRELKYGDPKRIGPSDFN